MNIGRLKKSIQEYFWLEIYDVIGRAYKAYHDARSEALNRPPTFEHTSMNVLNLDLDMLRKVSELANEIATQEKHLAALTAEIAEDETRFRNRAKTILSVARSNPQDPHMRLRLDSFERITAAFDECLSNWFNARNDLIDEQMSRKLKEMTDSPERRQLKAMGTMLNRILNIRRIYAALEIFMPVLFAFGAILYVWLR